MANTITITSIQNNPTGLTVNFKIKLSGSYVQIGSGGEVLNFAAAGTDPVFLGLAAVLATSNQTPIAADLWSTSGQTNYGYFFVAGALNACKVKIISAYNTELAGGAYPAGITGDTIEGTFFLQKNI